MSTENEELINITPNEDELLKEEQPSEVTPTTQAVETNQSGEESKYKEGEILKFVKVRFPGHAKSFPFLVGKRRIQYGQKVVAMSERGMTLGYVNSFPYELPFTQEMLPLYSISKLATDKDLELQKAHSKREQEAEEYCIELIKKYNLDMELTHLEFTQFGKKAVFYFIAPARVDFRDLVKDLVNKLKMRIELRQISIRDRAAALGGLGPCGRELCCSSFLNRFGNCSIKMAKNQSLNLIPSKINGACGQLKCCTQYEDEVYLEKRSRLPEEGQDIVTKNGDMGRVRKLHILIEQFEMLTLNGNLRRYSVNQFDPAFKLPDNYVYPEQFEQINNETSTVIGLTDLEREKAERFSQENDENTSNEPNYADEINDLNIPEEELSDLENEAILLDEEKENNSDKSPPFKKRH